MANPYLDDPEMVEPIATPTLGSNPYLDDPEMSDGELINNVAQDETGVAATLPMPSDNMFADMADEDARLVYDAYSRHPETKKDEQGNLIYKGIPVPPAEGNHPLLQGMVDTASTMGSVLSGGYSPVVWGIDKLLGTNIGGGIRDVGGAAGGGLAGGTYEAARDIAVGGMAAAEMLPSPGLSDLSDINPGFQDLSVQMDENIPEFNPEGTGQHLGSIATEVGAGILLGNKTQAALKAAGLTMPALNALKTKLPKVVKYLAEKGAAAMAGSVGTAATVDGSNDTMVIGRGAELPIFEGLQNTDPGTAARIVEDRANVLLDSLLLSVPVDTLADGGKKVAKILYNWGWKPTASVFSGDMRSRQVVESVMDAVGKAVDPSGTSPEKREFWKQKIVTMLQDPANSRVRSPTTKKGVSGVDVTLDTAATVRRGIDAIDPKAPGNELFDPNDAKSVKTIFTETSKGLTEDARFGQTALARNAPVEAADKLFRESGEAYGGPDAVDRGREGLQRIGEGRVQDAFRGDPTDANQKQLTDANTAFVKSLSDQSDLGSKIVDAKDEPFSETFVERNRLTKEILDAEETGSNTIKSESDRLLESISDKAQPRKTLDQSLEAAHEYVTEDMKQIMREAGMEMDDDTGEFLSMGSLKALQRLRAPLRAEITRLRDAGSPGADLLQSVLDDISNVKGNVGKDALKKYIDFEDQTVAPMTRQGLPKELSAIRQANRTDLPKKADTSAATLRGTLSGDKPDTVSHLADVLSDERYGKSHDKIAQYAYVDVVDQARRQIKNNPLSEIDAEPILAGLTRYRQAMTNPKFEGHLKKLDEFEALIRKHKGDTKALEVILKTKINNPEAMKKEILNDLLGEFFTSQGIRKPNAFESFRELFLDKQSTGLKEKGRLDKLIKLAEKENPVILDGMRAAWTKHLQDQLSSINNAVTDLSASKINEALQADSHIMRVGEKLFKSTEDRQVFNAIRVLLPAALDSTLAKKSGSLKLESVGEAARDARSAVSQMVRLVYGPLSRQGTSIGAITQGILDFKRPKETALHLADAMMKDPSGFLSAYNKSLYSWGKKNGRGMRDLVKWMIQSGVYNTNDEKGIEAAIKKASEEQQTEEVFPKEGGASSPTNPKRGAEMKSYDPSLREKVGNAVYDLATKMGLRQNAQHMREVTEAAIDFVPLAGGATGVDDTKRAAQRGDYREAVLSGVTTALGEIPGGGDVAAGVAKAIFGGIGAKAGFPYKGLTKGQTPDLNRAEENLQQASSDLDHEFITKDEFDDERDYIWKDTGWFRGKDGEMRFEIADDQAEIKMDVFDNPKVWREGKGVPLDLVLEHKELFEAYPELKEITVFVRNDNDNLAYYMDEDDSITLNLKYMKREGYDVKEILLHEIQHAVQSREGFARGTAIPDVIEKKHPAHKVFQEDLEQSVAPMSKKDWEAENKRASESGFPFPQGSGTYEEYVEKHNAHIEKYRPGIEKSAKERAAREYYNRSAGETEADVVQKRMKYKPEDRYYMKAPWDDYRTSEDRQIVERYGKRGKSFASVDKGKKVTSLFRGEPVIMDGPKSRSHPGGVFFYSKKDKDRAKGFARAIQDQSMVGAVRELEVPDEVIKKLAPLHNDKVYRKLLPKLEDRSLKTNRGVMPMKELIDALKKEGYTGYYWNNSTGQTEYYILDEALENLKYKPLE